MRNFTSLGQSLTDRNCCHQEQQTVFIVPFTVNLVPSPITQQSLVGWGRPHHYQRFRVTLCEWSALRSNLYLTTRLSLETYIHALGGIRTHNPRKQAAANRLLRPFGSTRMILSLYNCKIQASGSRRFRSSFSVSSLWIFLAVKSAWLRTVVTSGRPQPDTVTEVREVTAVSKW